MWRSPSQWTMISTPAARANATSTSSSVAIPVEIREVGCTVARSVVAVITPPSHAAAAPRGASTSSHGASRSTRLDRCLRVGAALGAAPRRRRRAGGSRPAAGGARRGAPRRRRCRARRGRREGARNDLSDSRMWCALSPRTAGERSAPSAAASASQNAGVSAVRKRPILAPAPVARTGRTARGGRRTRRAARPAAAGRSPPRRTPSSGQQRWRRRRRDARRRRPRRPRGAGDRARCRTRRNVAVVRPAPRRSRSHDRREPALPPRTQRDAELASAWAVARSRAMPVPIFDGGVRLSTHASATTAPEAAVDTRRSRRHLPAEVARARPPLIDAGELIGDDEVLVTSSRSRRSASPSAPRRSPRASTRWPAGRALRAE